MDMVLRVMQMEVGIQANIYRAREKDMDATTSNMVKNIKGCGRMVR